MSKNINVNPGQDKVKGRERQGEDIVHVVQKSKAASVRKGSAPKLKAGKKR